MVLRSDSVEVVSVMFSLVLGASKDLFSSGLVMTSLVDELMTSIALSWMLLSTVSSEMGGVCSAAFT